MYHDLAREKEKSSKFDTLERPPFQVVNRNGGAPVVIVADHASRHIPPVLNRLGLSEMLTHRHIAWDAGSEAVATHLSEYFDAPAVVAGFSRLVIDPNRYVDNLGSIPTKSGGFRIAGNENLPTEEVKHRQDTYFWPYHDAISDVLAAVLARDRVPVVISVHSFTPAFDHTPRPWQIGVLWDRDERISRPLIDALSGHKGLCIGDNQPYSAKSPYGFTMDIHGEIPGYPHVLLEIRKDLINFPKGARQWASLISEALAPILADERLYRCDPRQCEVLP